MEAAALDRLLQLMHSGLNISNATDIPATVLPKDCKIESLEPLLNAPRRMRRTFKTQRLTDFIAYVEEEKKANSTAVFVAADGESTAALIDCGTHASPEWADHRAFLSMKHTPEFAALENICGTDLSQRDLLDWLEDWHPIISPQIDEKDVTVAQAAAAISNVRIEKSGTRTHEEKNFGAARTAMEEIEARSKEGNLPGRFAVRCAMYHDTEIRTITARMSLLTSTEQPRFRLRIVGEETLRKEIAEEIQNRVRTALADDVRVFVGNLQ